MSVIRAQLFQRVFGAPLLIEPGKAAAGLRAIGGRIVAGGVRFDRGVEFTDHVAFEGADRIGRLGDRLGRSIDRDGLLPFDFVQGVAVIPVEGTLVNKGAFVGMSSGNTSYQGLNVQIARAAANPAVLGVAYEVDTFGGEADGAFECAELMRRLSAKKPTIAILTENACSGGYLLAAQQRTVIASEHGRIGSIGAARLHVDESEALAAEGLKVTILTSGSHKADQNPFEPLPDDVAAGIREDLDAMRRTFSQSVAKGRGRRFTEAQAWATEAEVFRGDEGVGLGLADAVAHPTDAFAEFVRAVNRNRA